MLEALPPSGTIVSGKLYRLHNAVHPTCANDGFALHIPTQSQTGQGLLPTPTASDGTTGAILNEKTQIVYTSNGTPRKLSNTGVNGSLGLARTIMLLPTPTACDPIKQNTGGLHRLLVMGQKYSAGDHRATNQPKRIGNERRHLNPQFVEWMMGYPEGWIQPPDDYTKNN